MIKWNPSVKSHKEALWKALLTDRLDVVATDHAPHTLEEKNRTDYLKAPAGGPMVQHALPAMLHQAIERDIPFTTIVKKMCHNPAKLFDRKKRIYQRGVLCRPSGGAERRALGDQQAKHIIQMWVVSPFGTYAQSAGEPHLCQWALGI